ncbi:MAG: hypothetical protein ACMUIS_07520 [bacterium]
MKKSVIAMLIGILGMVLAVQAIAQTNPVQWMVSYQGDIPSYQSWSLQNVGTVRTSQAYNYPTYASSGWLNHPPIQVYTPSFPMVTKAGQTASWTFGVIDPDADQVYASSSIGASGQPIAGTLNWSFTPNFPGVYLLNTTVYDERGGFARIQAPVVVKPWWSF